MYNNNNFNAFLNNLSTFKSQGKNPQMIMQTMLQQNPQLQQTLVQLKNMANGRNPQEFFTQLAKQNGLSQDTLNNIMNLIRK